MEPFAEVDVGRDGDLGESGFELVASTVPDGSAGRAACLLRERAVEARRTNMLPTSPPSSSSSSSEGKSARPRDASPPANERRLPVEEVGDAMARRAGDGLGAGAGAGEGAVSCEGFCDASSPAGAGDAAAGAVLPAALALRLFANSSSFFARFCLNSAKEKRRPPAFERLRRWRTGEVAAGVSA